MVSTVPTLGVARTTMAAAVQPVLGAKNAHSKNHSKNVNTSRQCQKTHKAPIEMIINMNTSDNCRRFGRLAGFTSRPALGPFSLSSAKFGACSRSNRWRSIFLSSARATSNRRLVSPRLRALSKATTMCLFDQIVCLRQPQDWRINDNRLGGHRRIFSCCRLGVL